MSESETLVAAFFFKIVFFFLNRAQFTRGAFRFWDIIAGDPFMCFVSSCRHLSLTPVSPWLGGSTAHSSGGSCGPFLVL